MCFPVLNASSLLEVNFYSTAQFIFFINRKITHTPKKKPEEKKERKKKCLPSYRPQTGHKYLQ